MSEYTLKIESPGRYGIWQYEATVYAPDGSEVGRKGFDGTFFIRHWARKQVRWHRYRSTMTIKI